MMMREVMKCLDRAQGGRNLPERLPAGCVERRRHFERWELKSPLVVRGERGRGSFG